MSENQRATAREIVRRHLDSGDPFGWFEDLYSQARREPSIIPWADLEPNPNLIDWLDQHGAANAGLALKIGNGGAPIFIVCYPFQNPIPVQSMPRCIYAYTSSRNQQHCY